MCRNHIKLTVSNWIIIWNAEILQQLPPVNLRGEQDKFLLSEEAVIDSERWNEPANSQVNKEQEKGTCYCIFLCINCVSCSTAPHAWDRMSFTLGPFSNSMFSGPLCVITGIAIQPHGAPRPRTGWNVPCLGCVQCQILWMLCCFTGCYFMFSGGRKIDC